MNQWVNVDHDDMYHLSGYDQFILSIALSNMKLWDWSRERDARGRVVRVVDLGPRAPHRCEFVRIPPGTLNSFMWRSYPASFQNVGSLPGYPLMSKIILGMPQVVVPQYINQTVQFISTRVQLKCTVVGTTSMEYVLLVLLLLPPDVYAQEGHIPPYRLSYNSA